MSKLPNAKTMDHQSLSRANGASKDALQAAPLSPQTVIALQRAAGNRAVGQLLVGGNSHTEPNGNGNGNGSEYPNYLLQRKPASGTAEGALEEQAERVETAVAKEPVAGKMLLVEDDVQSLQPGQMHKSEFLSALKTSVCAAADEELEGTIWSTMGCPYVERWFEVYESKGSVAVERALHKYAPETAMATSAEQYIPLVTLKVRKGVAVWRKTGQVTDVPPEFAQGGMPGATFEGLVGAGLSALGGAIGGAVSKAASAVGGAISGAARAIGSGIAGIGRALFKAQPGGATKPQDTNAVQAQLQGGHPLESEVRGKMETAFGQDFSRVRVHADVGAAHLSQDLNARAFTVGHDVAFGAGEYRPGTLIGDALIAHELAHVVQQGSGKTQGTQTKGAAYDALEADADVVAIGAVASQFSGAQGALLDVGREAMPRLRSGLQLQRCASSQKKVTEPGKGGAATTPVSTSFPQGSALTERVGTQSDEYYKADDTARAIGAAARDTTVDEPRRGVAMVQSIINTYYSSHASKVTDVASDTSFKHGLMTTSSLGKDKVYRGTIHVGSQYIQDFIANGSFSHEVLRVGHEIEHIDQHSRGMGGGQRQHEREFMAFYMEGLAEDLPHTGRLQRPTRVGMIDCALRHYNCLKEDDRTKYAAHQQKLLKTRSDEMKFMTENPRKFPGVSDLPASPPTECADCSDEEQ